MASRVLHEVSRFSVSSDRLSGEDPAHNEERFRAQMDERARAARTDIDTVRAQVGQVTDVTALEVKVGQLQGSVIALADDSAAQDARIDTLASGVATQGDDLAALDTALTSMAARVATMEEAVATLTDTVAEQAAQIAGLEARIEALETPEPPEAP